MRIFIHAMLCLSVISMVVLVSLALSPPATYGGGGTQGQQNTGIDPCPNPFDPSTGQFIGFSTAEAANRWGLGVKKVNVIIEIKNTNGQSFNPPKFRKINSFPQGPVKRCIGPSPAGQGPAGQATGQFAN